MMYFLMWITLKLILSNPPKKASIPVKGRRLLSRGTTLIYNEIRYISDACNVSIRQELAALWSSFR